MDQQNLRGNCAWIESFPTLHDGEDIQCLIMCILNVGL
jgi:hypothetical protein